MLKKNFHIIFIVFAVFVIIYGFISSNINSKRLIKYSKFTVAEIISDWHYKNNTGIGVDYVYSVNNRKYNYTINLDLKKGERYLLVYDSLIPSNCRVLDIYPILDKEITPPANGWKDKDVPIVLNTKSVIDVVKTYK